jgi:hypothetical protein
VIESGTSAAAMPTALAADARVRAAICVFSVPVIFQTRFRGTYTRESSCNTAEHSCSAGHYVSHSARASALRHFPRTLSR